MKKITILAAFALMAAGASAGQMAAPDSMWYVNSAMESEGNKTVWSSVQGDIPYSWFTNNLDDGYTSFQNGRVAVFNDNDLLLFEQMDIPDPGIRTYFVDLQENFTIGGLYVDNDSITYHLSDDATTHELTGADGALFEKGGR